MGALGPDGDDRGAWAVAAGAASRDDRSCGRARPGGRDFRRAARARAHRPRPRGKHLALLDGPLDERLRPHRRPDDRPLAAFRVAHRARESVVEFLSMRRRALDLLRDDPERPALAGFLPRARPTGLAERSALQRLDRTRAKTAPHSPAKSIA